MQRLSLTRLPNWNVLFVEEIHRLMQQNDRQPIKFDWAPNQSDAFQCITFSSHMVQIITGEDLYHSMAVPELKYDSPRSALKVLNKMGYDNVDQLIGSLFEEQPLTYTQRGDLILVDAGSDITGHAVAVADPPFFWVVTTGGLSKGNLFQAVKSFKVG